MAKEKISYEDFIATVNDKDKDFVNELHIDFTSHGCKIEIKEAKSGFVVSYTFNKKTVANYVFRKSGLIIRIYANHIVGYMEFLDTFPVDMIASMQTAPVCKRLINPDDCNSRCAMGYDFILKGERQQKCRIGAFMFLLNDEHNPYIKSFVSSELKACE